MLRIIQSTNSAATKNYYSKSDYYVTGQEQEIVGRWGGKAAEALGLRGEVERDAFNAMCDNLNPNTGERLTQRMNQNRRVGWDFNLHVPKSVSVIYGRSQDERILDIVRKTGEDVMALMEAEVRTRLRKGGMNETTTIGNWAYGEFVHFTARPVDGIADPHLHLHCFVFNAGLDPEGDWKALDIGGIKRDAPYFQAVFHSLLAERIAELGYGVRRTRQGWELDGVPDSVIKKFSRRTDEIEKLAAELGLKAGAEKDLLGAKTRKRKCKEMTMDELRDDWEGRLDDDERAALDRVAEGGVGGIPDVTADQALDYAIRHCMARDSAVTERQLVGTALRYGVGAVSAEEVRERFDDHGVITGFIDGELHASTRDVLAEERFLASFARDGKNTCVALGETNRPFSRDWLNAGQRAAVRHMLESQDRVIAVRGLAGVGKTTSLSEAREGIEEGGHELFVFANSSDASRGVLRSEGFEEADTIASLLTNEKLQQRIQGQVILIDEISQVGTRTLARVFDLADELDARVIVVGDEKQHGAVERGDVMRVLREQAGIVPVEVRDILRQNGPYKAAIQALADGRAQEGFDRLDALEWIVGLPDGEREQALAVAYADGVEAGKDMLAVSPTHREKDRVTEAIRQELKARELVGEEDREFTRLESVNLTDAERADAVNYETGDVVVFHQNGKGGFRKGQRIKVVGDGEGLPLHLAERFGVYRERSLKLSEGDRIRITANGTTKDGDHRLNNGAVYDVDGFTEEGDIVLDNGWIVSKDYGFLSHGLVLTSQGSQGRTVDEVLIAQSADSVGATTMQQFYVSNSRARERVRIFTDDKEDLRSAVVRSERRRLAHDVVAAPPGGQAEERGRLLEIAHHAQRMKALEAARAVPGSAMDTVKAPEIGYER